MGTSWEARGEMPEVRPALVQILEAKYHRFPKRTRQRASGAQRQMGFWFTLREG